MIVSLVIIAIIFGGVGAAILVAAPYEPSRVAVVMMAPGFGDMSKADTVFEGMDTLAHDVSVQYIIPNPLPTSVSAAQDILEEYASAPAGYYDLIIAVGEDLAPSLQTVATDFPNQKFAIIGSNVDRPNVASAVFEDQESAFLAGVVAAFLANNEDFYGSEPCEGKIGILGAMDDEEINVLIDGFIQGVQAANETYSLNVILMDTVYIGSWNDSTTAQIETTSLFLTHNVSLIFAPVRASYPGVRAGMLAADSGFPFSQYGRMPLVIAAEGNLDWFGTDNPDIPVAPSWISTSAFAHTDWAVYEIINKTLWDQFPGGQLYTYNLSNGGCNISEFEYSSTYMPSVVYDALEFYREQIADGIIVVSRDL